MGSPWAIGAEPKAGTSRSFRSLVPQRTSGTCSRARREHGLEIALDIAFQCAPDHPYVKAHPDWFRWRPDGSVQYAENPPKKYQDIYPFNFECDDWRGLWAELKSVFDHWIAQGVTHLPRGQPAHQGLSVLGVGHQRGASACTPT